VIAVNRVNIGRPSTDFLSGGVISSTLTCANTSAIDTIAGSQTQAVLYSVPKSVSSLTATDVLQYTTDKDMHLVSNISSKQDNTRTYAITEHNGERTALLRDKARSNMAEIEFSISASTSAAQGFTGNDDLAVVGSPATYTASDAIYHSDNDATYSPFSLATYVAHLALTLELEVKALTATLENAELIAVAFDAAGKAIDSLQVNVDPSEGVPVTEKFTTHVDVNLTSETVPISSVGVFIQKINGSTTPTCVLKRTTGVSSGRVSATEETADIPGRPIHFAVFEGLNAAASLNVHAANVIAGTPDSANAFISGGGATDDVFDYGIVNSMLLTFKHTFPRAYTGLGAQAASMALKEWFELEGMVIAMEARSFKKIGKTFKKLIKGAKQARSTVSKVADVAAPIMKEGGLILASGAFGPKGQALGAGMLAGAEGIEQAQKYGVLE
jgi:hypothetical protein